MNANPDAFLRHLQAEGYHSRSNKHSNSLAEAIVDDLIANCPAMQRDAAAGALVYDLNFTLRAGTADWNVDLVLGAPEIGGRTGDVGERISRRPPALVRVAIEIKSVMTEHRKAIKNRKRDLEAHHEHVHNYHDDAIAGGVLIVNAAATFRSPLRPRATVHRNPVVLVEHCIGELRSVAARGGQTGYGLEARCAIVVDMDNQNPASTRFLARPPAPTTGDPLHYDSFIRSICEHYSRRFSRP